MDTRLRSAEYLKKMPIEWYKEVSMQVLGVHEEPLLVEEWELIKGEWIEEERGGEVWTQCVWMSGRLEGDVPGVLKTCCWQSMSAPGGDHVLVRGAHLRPARVSLCTGRAFDSQRISHCGLWLRSLFRITNPYLYFLNL